MNPHGAEARRRLVGAVVLGCAALPSVARAHQVGISRGVYTAEPGATVHVSIALARLDVAAALELPSDRLATQAGLDAELPAIQRVIVEHLRVRTTEGSCSGSAATATLDEQDGVRIDARFACAATRDGAASTELSIEAGFVDPLGLGHRHLARVEGVTPVVEELLFAGKATLRASVPAMRPPRSPARAITDGFVAACASVTAPMFALAAALGVERTRGAIFTVVAASVGVGLGALAEPRGLAPGATALAALAALAALYVAAENALDPALRWRAGMTATLGLVVGARAASVGADATGAAACALACGGVAAGAAALLRRGSSARGALAVRATSALVAIGAASLFVKALV